MSIDLYGNIPRICTAFADWTACLFYLALMKRRFSGIRFAALSAAFLAILEGFMILTDGYHGAAFNFFMAVSVLIMLVFLFLSSKMGICTAGYFCARAFLLGGFAVSFFWQLYHYIAVVGKRLLAMPQMLLFMLLIFALVYGVMYLLEYGHRKEDQVLQISFREMVSCGILAAGVYILSSISYAPVQTPFGGSTDMEAYNIRTFVYLGGVAILFAYHLQRCELHMKQERDALQNILQMQYSNYQISQESIELVNQKYHDLKHQITILKSQLGNEQKIEYLDQMEADIKAYEAQNKTGNKVLDTVLTAKSIHCQKYGISMTCVADGAALSFMDVVDISTLFGNALDNAIESVSKIADQSKRLIHVSVARQKGFLRIRVENCYEGEITLENGLPSSTKQDKRFHGYGLKSIRSTVKKYGGSVTLNMENGWFELRILIPVGA